MTFKRKYEQAIRFIPIQGLGIGEEREAELEADKFMNRYHRSTSHIQGCMIESLSQDLDFRGSNSFQRQIIVSVLRRLAADMK